MENGVISIKNVLDIIFKITKKNANNLADSYLIKDPSIISKWKTDKSKPTSEDILNIVNFTFEESSSTQRKLMRDEIDILVDNSLLNSGIKHSLLNIADFKEFLTEVLNVSTSVNQFPNTQYSGNINPDEFPDSLKKRPQEYKTDSGTITAFSDGIDGKYSGTVEFSLVLSRDRGKNNMGDPDRKNLNFSSTGSFNVKSKIGKLRKQLISKTVLCSVLIAGISVFLAVQAANSNQSTESVTAVRNINVLTGQEINATVKPLPTEKTTDTASGKEAQISATVPSKNEDNQPGHAESKKTSNDNETIPESRMKPDVKNSSSTGQKDFDTQRGKNVVNKSTKIKNASNYASNNTTNNTSNFKSNNTINNISDISVNNSSNVTVNKDASIKGDNNVMGQGSNIFINVED